MDAVWIVSLIIMGVVLGLFASRIIHVAYVVKNKMSISKT